MSDEKKKYSLVDLGSIAQPIADVVCKLLNQLENAVGYTFPNKEVKDAEKNAHAYLIEEIMKDERFSPYERGVMVSSYKKYVKEHKNQTEIISKAVGFINENASPDDVEDDWFMTFMDKARLVSNEDMQLIWSEILAQEVNEPGSISKQLLHILAQMSKEDADCFMKLMLFCADICETGTGDNEFGPILFRTGDETIKEDHRVSFKDITTLECYGLVQFSTTNIYVEGTEGVQIKYGDKIVFEKEGYYKVDIGKVIFSKAGFELAKISERTCIPEIAEYMNEKLNGQ